MLGPSLPPRPTRPSDRGRSASWGTRLTPILFSPQCPVCVDAEIAPDRREQDASDLGQRIAPRPRPAGEPLRFVSRDFVPTDIEAV
jgi:hypothetical protein